MLELQGQDVIVAVALTVGLVKLCRGRIGAALADRLRGGTAPAADPMLHVELDDLRGRLAEVEERLDFAERHLARVREADQLPGGVHR